MQNETVQKPGWHHYVTAVFAGIFLANSIPHYINGISGNQFPSPFADPPGFGNSSPTINVLWGAANLLAGYLLFRFSKSRLKDSVLLPILFATIVGVGVMLSLAFAHRIP